MNDPEGRIERLLRMAHLLWRHPQGLTTGELARELGVDPSTVRRDLTLLEGQGTGTIKDGWRFKVDHERSFALIPFNNHELLALYFAARLLARYSDEHNPYIVKVLEKIAYAFKDRAPNVAHHIDLAAQAVATRPDRYAYVEALRVLTQGWIERRKVYLRYRDAKGEVTERVCAPYVMEPLGIGYACYVIGHDDLSDKVRTFKVERITEATLLPEQFEIPAAYADPSQVLSNAWGVIWAEEEAIEVKLLFSAAVARRVKESTWHHSQEVQDQPDGSCYFTVHVGSTLEMKPWIRQWGAAVKVIAPADLRQELMDEVRAMASVYGLPMNEDMS